MPAINQSSSSRLKRRRGSGSSKLAMTDDASLMSTSMGSTSYSSARLKKRQHPSYATTERVDLYRSGVNRQSMQSERIKHSSIINHSTAACLRCTDKNASSWPVCFFNSFNGMP